MHASSKLAALLSGALACACTGTDGASDPTPDDASAEEALAAHLAIDDELVIDGAMLDLAPATDYEGRDHPLLPRPLESLLASWGASPNADCVDATEWIDADRDAIPARWSAELDCTIAVPRGVLVRVNGAVDVADIDDDLGLSGVWVRFARLRVARHGPGPAFDSRTLDGTVDVRRADGRPVAASGFVMTRDLSIGFQRHLYSGNLETGVLETELDAKYLPDTDVARGDPFARGTLRFQGTTTLIAAGRERTFWRSTAPSLSYDRGCKARDAGVPPFDGGAYVVMTSSRNAQTVEFSGCNRWKTFQRGVPF